MDTLKAVIKMARVKRVIAKPDDIIFFDAVDSVLNGQGPYGVASRHILEMNQETDFKKIGASNMDLDGMALLSRLVENKKR